MNEPCTDPIVEASVAILRARSRVGVEKYGVGLADSPDAIAARIRHLKEELADALNYAVWAEGFLTKPCVWKPNVHRSYARTGCEATFRLSVLTTMTYCPKCGRKLEQSK